MSDARGLLVQDPSGDGQAALDATPAGLPPGPPSLAEYDRLLTVAPES